MDADLAIRAFFSAVVPSTAVQGFTHQAARRLAADIAQLHGIEHVEPGRVIEGAKAAGFPVSRVFVGVEYDSIAALFSRAARRHV